VDLDAASRDELIREVKRLQAENAQLRQKVSDAGWDRDLRAQEAYQSYGRSADGWL
jgi:hypothetical protein